MVHALEINPTTFPAAKFSTLASIVNLIVPILVGAAGVVAFGMALYGAYTIMTAGGNTERFKQAQKIFGSSIAGLIIVILSFVIVKIIEFILKVDLPL